MEVIHMDSNWTPIWIYEESSEKNIALFQQDWLLYNDLHPKSVRVSGIARYH